METGQIFNPYRTFVGSFIPNALMQFRGLSAGAKLVWARLAQFMGEKGECFPSIETLASETGLVSRYIIKLLFELEQKKFIKIERASGKDKLLHKTNRYYFLWHSIFDSTSRSEQIDTSRSEQIDTSRSEQIDTSRSEQIDTQKRIISEENHNRKESDIRESSSSLTELKKTDTDDDDFNFLYKKFPEYPVEKIKAAVDKMREIEENGHIIKNRTGYLRKMLKDGFDDVVPTPHKQKPALTEPDKYKNIRTTHINNVTGEMWVTGG